MSFTDSEGKISLERFVDICYTVIENLEIRRRAIEKFNALDQDKSGYLDSDELHEGEWVSEYGIVVVEWIVK